MGLELKALNHGVSFLLAKDLPEPAASAELSLNKGSTSQSCLLQGSTPG